MKHFTIRTLTTDDFAALASLEKDVFGAMGEEVLCPHYLRLCTEIFSPAQLFSALGRFNPVKPHRLRRTLRRHLPLIDFLLHATASHARWIPA